MEAIEKDGDTSLGITQAQLSEVLSDANPETLKVARTELESLLAREEARFETLDRKASTLMGAVGFSLTVTVAVARSGSALPGTAGFSFRVIALVAAACWLVSAWFAFRTVLLTNIGGRSAKLVLNPETLNRVPSAYDRYLILLLENDYRDHREANSSKAKRLSRAQWAYGAGILAVTLSALALMVASI